MTSSGLWMPPVMAVEITVVTKSGACEKTAHHARRSGSLLRHCLASYRFAPRKTLKRMKVALGTTSAAASTAMRAAGKPAVASTTPTTA